jgi:D-amino-acid dehydrogenase
MNIVVVGCGIVGVCTAMALHRRGHTVTVIEAASDAALVTSYANAGLLSPGHCFSWAEPGIARGILKAFLTGADYPRIGTPRNKALFRWLRRFIAQSSPTAWQHNSYHALRLSQLSRDVHFREEIIPLHAYDAARNGLLYLYKAATMPAESELKLLQDAGEPFHILHGDALRAKEPALQRTENHVFETGTYCEKDAYGDARLYAQESIRLAQQSGVNVLWNTSVKEIMVQQDRVTGVSTNNGFIPSEGCIITSGQGSVSLLNALGYDLFIQPISGYSLTYQGVQGERPQHAGVSIADKIAWAPFGQDRIRFTGFADVGMPSKRLAQQRFASLKAFAQQLCPSVQEAESLPWIGQRPMTPDGLPYIGQGAHQGLYLNCGHGAMGWTMAHGSAHVLAQVIENQQPDIELHPFRYDRRFL